MSRSALFVIKCCIGCDLACAIPADVVNPHFYFTEKFQGNHVYLSYLPTSLCLFLGATQAVVASSTVICVGMALLDQVFEMIELPAAAGKYFAQSLQEVGGGIAANGAVTVCRLGGRALLCEFTW